jgi:hypothetical protein
VYLGSLSVLRPTDGWAGGEERDEHQAQDQAADGRTNHAQQGNGDVPDVAEQPLRAQDDEPEHRADADRDRRADRHAALEADAAGHEAGHGAKHGAQEHPQKQVHQVEPDRLDHGPLMTEIGQTPKHRHLDDPR